MTLEWHGDELVEKVHAAERAAINATMAGCLLHAKANHGPGAHAKQRFETQTGELERSIQILEPAVTKGGMTRGVWGARGVNYILRQELGFQGKDALGRVYNQSAFPFLFPAADAEYPKLFDRLKRALR